MKTLNFSKLSGQGNDFIIINATKEKVKLSTSQITNMCDRHFGIGADGLILIRKSDVANFYMDFYNQDGSAAEMCGNGIRCMAYFIGQKNLSNKSEIKIETLAGIKDIEIKIDSVGSVNSNAAKEFNNVNNEAKIIRNIRVNMGNPEFTPQKIPVDISRDNSFSDGVDNFNTGKDKDADSSSAERILNYPIKIEENRFSINCVSMGNPHCVIFLDETFNLEKIPIGSWGPAIENYPIFPNKTNAGFVRVKNKNEITMRVWERGVGETLACGTGACAASVCSIILGKTSGAKIKVNLPGGILDIYWKGKDFPVFLEGSVVHIFDGKYFL
ncbi:MAG: diaminopimelate epimerase [Actinobacteria bacterium]|nr:diaminopimelate epimerase [Actinomycetota bacterium]